MPKDQGIKQRNGDGREVGTAKKQQLICFIFSANGFQRKVGIEVLISDDIDFKIKKVKKDTEGYFVMTKGNMHQEDITLLLPIREP